MTAQPEQPAYTPEFIASLERFNLFHHVHFQNKTLMKNVGSLIDELQTSGAEAVSVDFMLMWLDQAGESCQTVDALMHILQDEFTGEVKDWLTTASGEEAEAARDSIDTPILAKMERILFETPEERTQRILLEMLNIHDN